MEKLLARLRKVCRGFPDARRGGIRYPMVIRGWAAFSAGPDVHGLGVGFVAVGQDEKFLRKKAI